MIMLAGLLLCIGVVWLFTSRSTPRFEGTRAFGHLLRQCEFGPRNPGSEGHRQCLGYLTAELEKSCEAVRHETFSYVSKRDPSRTHEGTNVVASARGTRGEERRIMLCAHWDTRPFADRDPDPANRHRPIVGANDGASGVGVLLEMARLLKERPPAVSVDIVLFDLEDMGTDSALVDPRSRDPFCIGSRHFATSNPSYRPLFGILLDMVGKRDLRIRKEAHSLAHAPQIVEKVWAAARRLGATAFLDERGPAVEDDHLPFLQRGIPVIDLIDLDYPFWHTLQDTPDKCSPESLQQVGDVLVEVIYRE
jgi:hypothetical protein